MKSRFQKIAEGMLEELDIRATGENTEGVPSYVGHIPPRALCWMQVLVGGGFLAIAFLLLCLPLPDGYPISRGLLRVIFAAGILLMMVRTLGSGTWTLHFLRRLSRLTSQEQLCKQLGLTQKELKQITEERGVQARCILNGEDYYDLADFREAVTLLRASSQPVSPQEMLRPALESDIPPEQLLRPTTSEEDA